MVVGDMYVGFGRGVVVAWVGGWEGRLKEGRASFVLRGVLFHLWTRPAMSSALAKPTVSPFSSDRTRAYCARRAAMAGTPLGDSRSDGGIFQGARGTCGAVLGVRSCGCDLIFLGDISGRRDRKVD